MPDTLDPTRPLPVAWDGRAVTWGDWKPGALVFICDRSKRKNGLTHPTCDACGSITPAPYTFGLRQPEPGATVPGEYLRRHRNGSRVYAEEPSPPSATSSPTAAPTAEPTVSTTTPPTKPGPSTKPTTAPKAPPRNTRTGATMPEKALTLRLDEATYERLRREAFEQRVTISDIIRDSLTARFKTWDRDDSGPWPASRESTRRAEHVDGGL